MAFEVDGKLQKKWSERIVFTSNKAFGLALSSGRHRVNPAQQPKHLDVILRGDPETPVYCIYSLEGDELKVCVPLMPKGRSESPRRPETFETKDRPVALITARRDKAPITEGASLNLPDAEIAKLLVGKWLAEDNNPKSSTKLATFFREDGTFEARGTVGSPQKPLDVAAWGTWKVVDQSLIQVVDRWEPRIGPTGKTSLDWILSIDDDAFRVLTETGKLRVSKRIRE